MTPSPEQNPASPWTAADSEELYQVAAWSEGYFGVDSNGHVRVTPDAAGGPSVDLHDLVVDLRRRGHPMPVLVRFSEILRHRLEILNSAFSAAIEEYGYRGTYRTVYPIKVNQQSDILEELLIYGKPFRMGIEAGSKPELLVALASMDQDNGVIVCNGYKDRIYIETALLAQQLGRWPILVVDRFDELETILEISRLLELRPHIGIRARLTAKGAGRWNESGGSKSKFGLSASEIVQVVERLTEVGMLDCLELVHFHIGSQINEIRAIKNALREAARFYTELHRMGARPQFLDVGGGLGVDYDGSNSSSPSSINYTLQEYANDVVDAVQQVCDEVKVPHPEILSESGRALAAYHSVLVVDVLGRNKVQPGPPTSAMAHSSVPTVRALYEAWETLDGDNFLEVYHDALQLKDEADSLFALGYLDLPGRATAEDLFAAICLQVRQHGRRMERPPDELEVLDQTLADTYFCNFSVFQSLPDSWAVDQLFPVMPIHRLHQRPTRQGTIADLTCDSDGRVARFIDQGEAKQALELHDADGQPYYLGIFLIGAYQETLGDLHNLFGDTTAVHVTLDSNHGYRIDRVVEADTVKEVLEYVQYEKRDLTRRVLRASEDAVRRGSLSMEQSGRLIRRFEEGLSSYTYLSPEHLVSPASQESTRGVGRDPEPDPPSAAVESG